MIAYYLQIKWVHVAAVIASGALFGLRGLLVWAGREQLAMWAPLRYLSYSIDTVLLTAALMLVTILHQYPFVHAWLTVKVLLLVVYIVLGTLAFGLLAFAQRPPAVAMRRPADLAETVVAGDQPGKFGRKVVSHGSFHGSGDWHWQGLKHATIWAA